MGLSPYTQFKVCFIAIKISFTLCQEIEGDNVSKEDYAYSVVLFSRSTVFQRKDGNVDAEIYCEVFRPAD